MEQRILPLLTLHQLLHVSHLKFKVTQVMWSHPLVDNIWPSYWGTSWCYWSNSECHLIAQLTKPGMPYSQGINWNHKVPGINYYHRKDKISIQTNHPIDIFGKATPTETIATRMLHAGLFSKCLTKIKPNISAVCQSPCQSSNLLLFLGFPSRK